MNVCNLWSKYVIPRFSQTSNSRRWNPRFDSGWIQNLVRGGGVFGQTTILSNCYCCLTSPFFTRKLKKHGQNTCVCITLGGSTEPPLDPPQCEVFVYDHKIRPEILCWHTIAKGFSLVSFSASVAFLVSTHMKLSFSKIIFIIFNYFTFKKPTFFVSFFLLSSLNN